MINARIVKYTNYFSILAITPRVQHVVNAFFHDFVQYELRKVRRRFIPVKSKMFARRSKRDGTFCGHINTLPILLERLKQNGLGDDEIEIKTEKLYRPKKIKLSMGEMKPYEKQIPIIEHCIDEGYQKCIASQMGSGKTAMAFFIAEILQTRFMVVTLGGWADRWSNAASEYCGLTAEDFIVCCGAIPLVRVLKRYAKGELNDMKGIFISTTGLRDYANNYNEGLYKDAKGVPDVPPEKLCEYLKIGLKITDEAHKQFRANYISDLYTHCPKTLYLTATLLTKDEFIQRMYDFMLPEEIRHDGGELNVYIDAVQVDYYLKEPDKARTVGGTGMYSHATYEQWIMSDKERLQNYLRAIFNYLLKVWIVDKLDGERIIIWSATIEMVEELVAYFRKRAPDLIINKFVSGDPYFILQDSDIISSTLGKSGTAVDIADLTQAHMTTNISSYNANLQALGRLREIVKGPFKDVPLIFFWYTCMNIPKHVEYAKEKKELIKDRVKNIRSDSLGVKI